MAEVQSGVDWIRCTGRKCLLGSLVAWAERRWGREYTRQRGFEWFGQRYSWAGGPEVSFEHSNGADVVQVDLGGSCLAPIPVGERVVMLRELMEMGFGAKRLDLNVDVIGEGLRLPELVRESCRRGELCRGRRWHPYEEFSGRRRVGDGVYLGRRGRDGSGRYVRAYDKGLEQKKEAARHQRWEVELSDGCAQEAARLLCEASPLFVDRVIASVALGSFDFREATGRKHLADRPRVEWWAEFIGSVSPVVVRQRPRLVTLAGRVTWLGKAVLPGLCAMAEVAGRSVGEVLHELGSLAGVEGWRVERAKASAAVAEFRRFLSGEVELAA